MADDENTAVAVDDTAGIFEQLETVLAEADKADAGPVATPSEPETPPVIEAKAAEATPAVVETKPAPAADAKPDPATERTLARLAAREEAVAKAEAENAEFKKRNQALVSQFRRNPVEALKAIGVPDDEIPQVIRASMATQLPPDKVPPQYKEIQARLAQEDRFKTQEAELSALRAELQQEKAQIAQQQAVAQYEAETRTYLAGAESDAPHLAKLFKAKPDLAMRRLFDVAQADAKGKLERASKGEQVQPMTPAEAAKAVEAELAEYAGLLGVTAVTATTTNQATNAAKGKPSLSNRATQPTGVRPGNGATKIEEFDAQAEVDSWMRSVGL